MNHKKTVTVTTYYDCSKVEVKSLNTADNGATVKQTDNGDGTLTQKITCPSDTSTARFSLMTTTNSAESITCSKSTGVYTPRFLARCEETNPFTEGSGKTQFNLKTFPIKPCSSTDASAKGEWSPENMKKKIISTTDAKCGFRHKVPCIKDGKCTFDTEKSGCHYDHEKELLVLEYYVKLNTPVWTFTERDALVNKEAGTVFFWGCSGSYSKRRRRDAMDYVDFDGFEIINKRGANETLAGEPESNESTHVVAATTVGVCTVALMTVILTVLFVRMRKRRAEDVEALTSSHVDVANN